MGRSRSRLNGTKNKNARLERAALRGIRRDGTKQGSPSQKERDRMRAEGLVEEELV